MRVRLIQGAGWRTESCTGCSNRCVHAHRPVPCVLVCLPGPSRQQSAGLLRASHGQLSPAAAAPHRDTASCQGSTSRTSRCAAAVPLWTPASPQRGWLTCASVPTPLRAVASVCGRRRAVSWSAMAAGARAVFPSPHSPCLRSHENLAHICCIGLCRIHKCSLPLAPGHTGRPIHSPLQRGSNPMQSLCTAQGCSE